MIIDSKKIAKAHPSCILSGEKKKLVSIWHFQRISWMHSKKCKPFSIQLHLCPKIPARKLVNLFYQSTGWNFPIRGISLCEAKNYCKLSLLREFKRSLFKSPSQRFQMALEAGVWIISRVESASCSITKSLGIQIAHINLINTGTDVISFHLKKS